MQRDENKDVWCGYARDCDGDSVRLWWRHDGGGDPIGLKRYVPYSDFLATEQCVKELRAKAVTIVRCEKCMYGDADKLADGSPGICCRKSTLEDSAAGQRSRVWPVRALDWFCADGKNLTQEEIDREFLTLLEVAKEEPITILAGNPYIRQPWDPSP